MPFKWLLTISMAEKILFNCIHVMLHLVSKKLPKIDCNNFFPWKKKIDFTKKKCFLATAISISKWIAFFSVIVAPEILGKEIIDNNDFERIEKVGTKITLNVGTLRLLIFCFKVLIGSKPLASSKFVALACVVVSKISAASVIYFHGKKTTNTTFADGRREHYWMKNLIVPRGIL